MGSLTPEARASACCRPTPGGTRRSGRREVRGAAVFDRRAPHYWTGVYSGNATKRGWASCPHPSLPAGEIEAAVIERIKCIGRDPDLLRDTLAELRSIQKTRVPALTTERRRLDRELVRLRDRRQDNGRDQIGRLEARIAEIADELAVLDGQSIDRRDLAKTLALFDEIWACLFPREQERVMGLLVERIDFDAARETVAITFRPTGIRTLAEEIAEAQGVTA